MSYDGSLLGKEATCALCLRCRFYKSCVMFSIGNEWNTILVGCN